MNDTAADRPALPGRHVVGFGLAVVLATAAFGAVLGYAIPARIGVETVVVAGITLLVSPVTFALYGAVLVGTFLVTLLLVLQVVSQFDEKTV